MKSEKLYDAFNYIDDWYLDSVDTPQKEATEMKKRKHFSLRKTITYALAAVICISILTITAAATGWIPGLFYQLREKYPQDKELFEAAAQVNTDAVPEIIEIPHLDLSQFVLLEQYFDDNTILIGYDTEIDLPEPAVGIEPETELLNKIKNGTKMSEISWSDQDSWHMAPATENAKEHNLSGDSAEMDRMLKATLSETAYQKVWELMEKQGYVCIAVRNAWIGDHILINGVDTVEAYMESNAYADRTEYTSDLGYCIRLEPLPEDVRNQKQVTVTLNVRSSVQYWYMDLDGEGRVYYDDSSITTDPVSFELKKVG